MGQARYRLRQPPPTRQPMLHRIFRADPLTVREALVSLRQRFDGSAGDEAIGRLELALAEVLNNICEHGAPDGMSPPCGQAHAPMIHLCVARHVGGIACAITDDGRPLPPDCLGPRTLPWSGGPPATSEAMLRLPEGGYGWYLIQDLTTSLSYFREGRRNFLGFIVPVAEPMQGAAAPAG